MGNPEIAIVETSDPDFCESCNQYFLDTDSLSEAIMQIKEKMGSPTPISKGVYS